MKIKHRCDLGGAKQQTSPHKGDREGRPYNRPRTRMMWLQHNVGNVLVLLYFHNVLYRHFSKIKRWFLNVPPKAWRGKHKRGLNLVSQAEFPFSLG